MPAHPDTILESRDLNSRDLETLDLECRGLHKQFAGQSAVADVSFGIPSGSFFSILGPSGCGKTTLLRMLAGFLEPDSGDICIKGQSMLGIPPNKRPLNMVFQHLALFPMMSVEDNIAYGLKRRGADKAEIRRRVGDVLERVGLPDVGKRKPDALSGGQKQRIAIARCLVLEPAVLLLDEPLGALDLKLREQMKVELKQLQQTFGTTFVYITHDQSEALVMSDQVAVMNQGRFEQVGSPQTLYYQPATPFVAGFVGDSNRLSGTLQREGLVRIASGQEFSARAAGSEVAAVGKAVNLFVRPESITPFLPGTPAQADNLLEVQIDTLLFDGANSRISVSGVHGGPELTVRLPQTPQYARLREGDRLHIGWMADQALYFAAEPA
ncbi:ABC transporter ATP-binding protein [Halopseudomonas pelagia]|uniref:ABC transporter ATP-binding protein n=1 Tax=Halopseudomonas pelagia TaxID=553151 RepID=A0AA91TZF4_9GAMM|nr:ABC transporter ATP-binding protein [Halopseudomonas pelagia]PCC97790.1 spermidine/putrescine ABC transporter ATP-binding protein [Halopseudomonas pelagia]QFY57362.1 ABC transporter ATP-binding protein [Halopseudomonas pelagia]